MKRSIKYIAGFIFLAMSGLAGRCQDSVSYKIGCDYLLQTRFDDAIYWFKRSIEHKYKIPDSYRNMGISKAYKGDYAGARENLFYSLALDSSNERTYYQFGKFYFIQAKYDSSELWYSKAINKNKRDASFFDDRALARIGLKKLDKALADENEAIRLDPGSESYYNNRGLIKLKLKKYEEALSDFKKGLSIDSALENNVVTYLNAAFCKVGLKRYKEALDDCNAVLSKYPNTPYGLSVRGQAYVGLKRNAEACKDFHLLYSMSAEMGNELIQKYCR